MKIKRNNFDLILLKSNNTYIPINLDKESLVLNLTNIDQISKPTQTYLSNSLHVRSQNKGIQIQYINQNIQTVFIYFRTNKIKSFQGVLPFGINSNWNLKTAIFYLGQPPVKSKILTQIIYQNLGLGIVFQGPWSNDNALIDYCYFFKPNDQVVCSTCKRINFQDTKLGCKLCDLTKYCSKQCKDKHQFEHRFFCQQID